jgi:hypothetical protein
LSFERLKWLTNRQIESQISMLSRRLANLLFCIALLAQIAAPVMGAAAMAAEHGGRSAEICDPSLAAHARTAASTADPDKSPLGRHIHHVACAFCPLAGTAPLALATAWTAPRLTACSRSAPRGVASNFVPEILKHGAAPRAPPSLV